MKKTLFFVVALLLSSMVFADVKVETFTPKSRGETNTYQLTVASRTCDQATWTVLLGGIKKSVKVVKDGMLYIYKDGKYINVLGF